MNLHLPKTGLISTAIIFCILVAFTASVLFYVSNQPIQTKVSVNQVTSQQTDLLLADKQV